MDHYTADIQPLKRTFLPEDFKVSTWDKIEPFFKNLLDRPVNSEKDLEKWLSDMSELEGILTEDACWKQIRITTDTTNKEYERDFIYFVSEIQPKIQPYSFELNRKLINSPYSQELDKQKYFTYLRSVRNSIELYREENIPIQSKLALLQQKYGAITSGMSVEIKDHPYTLQQAAKFFEDPDRSLREEVYQKINDRRLEDREPLDDLYSELIAKRNQEALNAGFTNYRDYKFKELGRFDYTWDDCYKFHDGVKDYVLPLAEELYERKRKKLRLLKLRPWDLDAEPEGVKPLTPFKSGEELIDKAIACFTQLNPFFGDCMRVMKQKGNLDLESRAGKAPGGYNMPLAETGIPFIFMNAAGQMSDVVTIVHEGGHAIQAFLTHQLDLNAFKEYPMEIAEVASMSMELFSMDHWDVFFNNEEELRRAKIHELERVITLFPWIALIDKFQHWVYLHPNHTAEERKSTWIGLFKEFTPSIIDYSGLEDYVAYNWQKQLHLYEVPFYYIEYGIAQLGAIGLWRQFKKDQRQGLDNYVHALRLGSTRPLPELYKAAGLQFSFSPEHVRDLMGFVHDQLDELM